MKRKKKFQVFTICIMISATLISCGGGNQQSKSSNAESSGSNFDKMISLADKYARELKKIEEKAKTVSDINKLTKIAEELAKKEKELNSAFIDYVEKQSGNLLLPVEQTIYQEYFTVKAIQVISAESIQKITLKLGISALKTPFPVVDDRVYLKLVDKDGKMIQKLLAPKPFGKKDISEWDWTPLLSPSMFKGVVKAEVISEEAFKQS